MNDSEFRVASDFLRRGYQVLRNGWPDFLIVDADGKARGVEVKRTNSLSHAQVQMIGALKTAGIETVVVEVYGEHHLERSAGVEAVDGYEAIGPILDAECTCGSLPCRCTAQLCVECGMNTCPECRDPCRLCAAAICHDCFAETCSNCDPTGRKA